MLIKLWVKNDIINIQGAWGFLDPNIWGAKQGRRQNFGSGGGIQQKCTHQRRFIKFYFHKNLKNSPKFFKNKN